MLRILTRNLPSRQDGSLLILVLVFSLIVTLTVAAAVMTTTQAGKHSQYEIKQTEAQALAEGVTEIVQKDMLETVANFRTFPLTGSVTIDGETLPYDIVQIGNSVTRTDSDGFTMATQAYQITASVTRDRGHATIHRVVDLTMSPIFQYMIFYDDDLEILPGPDMILEGRVHTNGDLYMGVGGSSTLTVATEYLRTTGDLRRHRKNDGSQTGGTIDIKVKDSSDYQEMTPGLDSDHSDWVTLSQDTWNGTVQTGDHGVTEVASPSIGTIKAFTDAAQTEKGYYHENAGLVIVDSQAYVDGLPVVLPPGTIMERSMYDAREEKTVTVTEVDMGLLNGSGVFPDNGLIYAYRTDASTSQPNGFRLTNGSEIADNLTVVSEDPVYVRGDFNTVNKKGVAVISDAVNLLSNSWDDSKGPGDSAPPASETHYNVAVVTGHVPTPDGGGNYSGGFENLPRFHENWSGVSAVIRGSFVSVFESEIARQRWGKSNVYSPPRRDWRFDPDLLTAEGTPPFSPNAVYFRRVLWDDNLSNPLVTALEQGI